MEVLSRIVLSRVADVIGDVIVAVVGGVIDGVARSSTLDGFREPGTGIGPYLRAKAK